MVVAQPSSHPSIVRLVERVRASGQLVGMCAVVADRLASLLLDEKRVARSMELVAELGRYTVAEHTRVAREDLARRVRALRRMVVRA